MMFEIAVFDGLQSGDHQRRQLLEFHDAAFFLLRAVQRGDAGGIEPRVVDRACRDPHRVTDATVPFDSAMPKRRAGWRPSTSTNERRAMMNRSPLDA